MRRKKLVIGIGIFAVFLIVLGTILFITSDSKAVDEKEPTNHKTYSSLLELAKEMYSDGSYTKLSKDEKLGVYYMTFGEYKKKGYNVDIVDSDCSDDFKIMYFDIEDTDNFNPIYTINSCTDTENDDSNLNPQAVLLKIANELYESGEYVNLIRGDGGYYMTIGMYKERGYDARFVNPSCSDDSKVLLFDIDNKDKYQGNPVFVVYECN